MFLISLEIGFPGGPEAPSAYCPFPQDSVSEEETMRVVLMMHCTWKGGGESMMGQDGWYECSMVSPWGNGSRQVHGCGDLIVRSPPQARVF